MATKKTRTANATKKAHKRAKQPAKRTATDAKPSKYKVTETNRQQLIEAGVIIATYNFTPPDSELIETLSSQEVTMLIEVFGEMGPEFFEENSPNGFVF